MRPLVTALVLALAVVGLLTWEPRPVPVAAQQGCQPAGGEAPPPLEQGEGEFVFRGRGFGHGAGMSQYGAQGAARLGCDASAILTTYFPGVSVEQPAMPPEVIVAISGNAPVFTVEATGGAEVPWELCDLDGVCEGVASQPGGAEWVVHVQGDGSYEIREGDQVRWSGGDKVKVLRARLSESDDQDRVVRLPLTGLRYRWGILQLDSVAGDRPGTIVTLAIPSIERYLRGVTEVPGTWPAEALRAQAIAARSYTVARIDDLGVRPVCRCHVYPTQLDQVYRGYEQELDDAADGHGWVEAVDSTAGQVLRHDGETVHGFYASSHGGFSESAQFVFGWDLPYVTPLDDSRWDQASDNPYRTWSVGFSADRLGAATGVGRATAIELLDPRGLGGRVGDPRRGFGGVRIVGTEGTTTMSGNALKARLQLRSTLFEASGPS